MKKACSQRALMRAASAVLILACLVLAGTRCFAVVAEPSLDNLAAARAFAEKAAHKARIKPVLDAEVRGPTSPCMGC
jgi:hypothetical protein